MKVARCFFFYFFILFFFPPLLLFPAHCFERGAALWKTLAALRRAAAAAARRELCISLLTKYFCLMACVYTDWCKLQGERLRLAGIAEKCSFFVFFLAEGLGGWGGGGKKKKMVPLCWDLGYLKSAFLTCDAARKIRELN